jgi:glyoxylase-like metal-dependent hydrolase (beta-lactamase superfamily II)
MNNAMTLVSAALSAVLLSACAATSHAVAPATLGTESSQSALEAIFETPGPVEVETIVGARWQVDRKGLIDLDTPAAKQAHLVDGKEPIELLFHALHHPTRGLYLIDSGVEHAFAANPKNALIEGMLASFADLDKMVILTDTKTWIASQHEPVRGVFLTHLHLDHVLGLRDVPRDATVFTGPGEAASSEFMHGFTSSVIDASLSRKGALAEWQFSTASAGAELDAVIDIFGDQSVFAIMAPGHTPGSTAYLARTPRGPVLFVGDVSHTVWGWTHDVAPGTFSEDAKASTATFAKMRRFVARHPSIDVRLGHQRLGALVEGATK